MGLERVGATRWRWSHRGVAVILVVLTTTGCLSGPYWKDEPSFAGARGLGLGKRIVVSGFLSSQRSVSVTGSADISTILESATVQDIAARVAAGLRSHGLEAEARVDQGPRDLAADQLLLRGAVLSPDRYERNGWAAFTFTLFTLGLLGMVFPAPVALEDGRYVRYRVELIDHEGRLVLSTGDRLMIGYYETRYYGVRPSPIEQQALHELAAGRVIDAVAKALATP